ncbi:MBL fold metallo-hydrolase [Vibrio sp. RC27]
MKRRWWVLIMALLSCTFFKATQPETTNYKDSPQYLDSKFANTSGAKSMDASRIPSMIWRYIAEKRIEPTPVQPIPVHEIELPGNPDSTQLDLYRLGHSSTLFNLHGQYWLIDPVFSERTSPVQWIGPKRFHQPPIDLENLPLIAGVIISHDHYDHLDKDTIQQIHRQVENFVVPLGVKRHLTKWGVSSDKIVELDWWQHTTMGHVEITATPAQHFSGRGVNDGNKTLWASWVIKSEDRSVFFSGDSGYFDGFKEIGERYGPFDITLIENGAYDRDWPDIHMTPEQTLQAHLDVRGQALMPVHNGTFDLALHPWYEPFERIFALAEQNNVSLVTPQIGEKLSINDMSKTSAWWRKK